MSAAAEDRATTLNYALLLWSTVRALRRRTAAGASVWRAWIETLDDLEVVDDGERLCRDLYACFPAGPSLGQLIYEDGCGTLDRGRLANVLAFADARARERVAALSPSAVCDVRHPTPPDQT